MLLLGEDAEEEEFDINIIHLWDDKKGTVPNAVSYGKEFDESEEELVEGYGRILGDES